MTLPDIIRSGSPNGIDRFADSGIQQSLDRVLAALPAGVKGSAVAYATQDVAGMAVVAKLSKGWSVVMVADRPWKGARKLEYEAVVRFQW